MNEKLLHINVGKILYLSHIIDKLLC